MPWLAHLGRRADLADMQELMDELRARALGHAGTGACAVPRLGITVRDGPTKPFAGMYEPMLCFVLQGAKRVILGDTVHNYGEGSYLVASLDLPVTGQVIEASPEQPYMSVAMALDRAAIAALLLDLAGDTAREAAPGMAISPMTASEAEPLLRLVRLLDTPDDIAVMAPMIERELFYRLLKGPQGHILRQVARSDSRLAQIRRAVDWIRAHYAEPLRIGHLADLAGMSASSLHRHFKAVTAMSPLAYHKQVRLQEARRRLIEAPADASRVAFSVGYESASQFSREYARLFGLPPIRDAARLRAGRRLEHV